MAFYCDKSPPLRLVLRFPLNAFTGRVWCKGHDAAQNPTNPTDYPLRGFRGTAAPPSAQTKASCDTSRSPQNRVWRAGGRLRQSPGALSFCAGNALLAVRLAVIEGQADDC